MSGTVDIVEETARLREDNARYDDWIAQPLLDPSDASRTQLRELISTEF